MLSKNKRHLGDEISDPAKRWRQTLVDSLASNRLPGDYVQTMINHSSSAGAEGLEDAVTSRLGSLTHQSMVANSMKDG